MAKKKKAAPRKGKNVFKVAASNRAFKAAKKAAAKAAARQKKAWKKALTGAKRIVRRKK